MKIIDLLNTPLDKLPKKIKVADRIYNLCINEANQHYYHDDKCKYSLFSICCFEDLYEEVEIIEEHKIPEKINKNYNIRILDLDKSHTIKDYDMEQLIEMVQDIYDKQDDIIDYLQSKGE